MSMGGVQKTLQWHSYRGRLTCLQPFLPAGVPRCLEIVLVDHVPITMSMKPLLKTCRDAVLVHGHKHWFTMLIRLVKPQSCIRVNQRKQLFEVKKQVELLRGCAVPESCARI